MDSVEPKLFMFYISKTKITVSGKISPRSSLTIEYRQYTI